MNTLGVQQVTFLSWESFEEIVTLDLVLTTKETCSVMWQ